jgi:hypothetical protein
MYLLFAVAVLFIIGYVSFVARRVQRKEVGKIVDAAEIKVTAGVGLDRFFKDRIVVVPGLPGNVVVLSTGPAFERVGPVESHWEGDKLVMVMKVKPNKAAQNVVLRIGE